MLRGSQLWQVSGFRLRSRQQRYHLLRMTGSPRSEDNAVMINSAKNQPNIEAGVGEIPTTSPQQQRTDKSDPPKITYRSFLRQLWETYSHVNLTLEELRSYLIQNLRGLGLSKDDRDWYLRVIGPMVPNDPRFWKSLQQAQEQEEAHPGDSEYLAENWVKNFFRNDFTNEYEETAPLEWIHIALGVFWVLRNIRGVAFGRRGVMALQYRKMWDQGRTQALFFTVRAGLLTEPWVAQAILVLQWERVQGGATESTEKLLSQVAKALLYVGSGQRSLQSPQQREDRRQERVSQAGKRRNHQRAAQRLVTNARRQEQWLLDDGRSPHEAHREALRFVVKEFEKSSRAKDRDAILAIFKETFPDN